jgi:hypothetical protein
MARPLRVLAILALAAPALASAAVNVQADDISPDINTRDIVRHVVPRDAIPALVMPRYDEIKQASYMRPDDRVIALQFEGRALAYPTRILDHHEIVNDLVGGQPILITY